MKRLIVVGASGLIGAHLWELARHQKDLAVIGTCCQRRRPGLLYFDMLRTRLDEIVTDLGAGDVVCLLAAHSNPSWIHAHGAEAARLNVTATKGLIDVATDRGARLVFMSSVEVFDGKKGDYKEESAPNPLNLYGRMKQEIEEYLDARTCRSCIVRTGWNVGWVGEHRCVVTLTYGTLLRPGAKMAYDNTFSLIDVRDTARGLLGVCEDDTVTICHLASSPPVIRHELAALIKSTSRYGELMRFEVVPFAEIPYSEPRGLHNGLNNQLARTLLGLQFVAPHKIIRDKVNWLDARGRSGF